VSDEIENALEEDKPLSENERKLADLIVGNNCGCDT
jgi:hypothetical protein